VPLILQALIDKANECFKRMKVDIVIEEDNSQPAEGTTRARKVHRVIGPTFDEAAQLLTYFSLVTDLVDLESNKAANPDAAPIVDLLVAVQRMAGQSNVDQAPLRHLIRCMQVSDAAHACHRWCV
jgi:hypothetical protein